MGRRPCCSKEGLNRGAWTALEDKILKSYIMAHGDGNWRSLPKKAGLKRCGKSCRLRWLNYLRPDIKRGNISGDEEELIIRLHNLLGNRWSLIAGRLPGRTDNEIKNYWNTTLGKKAKAKVKAIGQQSSQPLKYDDDNNKHDQSSSVVKSKSKSESSQDHHHKPSEVIRTKATRCSTKVVFVPTPPLLICTTADENSSPPPEATVTVEPLLLSDLENQDRDYYPAIGINVEGQGIIRGSQFGPATVADDDLGLSLTLDEPIFNDLWVPTTAFCCPGGSDEENNATMDLESLAFWLDSDEWP